MHTPLDAGPTSGECLKVLDFVGLAAALNKDKDLSEDLSSETNRGALECLLACSAVSDLLIKASRAAVYDSESAQHYSKTGSVTDLKLLRCLKLLKYCYNLPCAQLVSVLSEALDLASSETGSKGETVNAVRSLSENLLDDSSLCSLLVRNIIIGKEASANLTEIYGENADWLLEKDPHAVFPTSLYRQCSGHVTSSSDSTLIEGVMGTTITTTIEICRGVLDPKETQLRDVYAPLKRCVAIVDERVDRIYGDQMTKYFAFHGIPLEKLVYRCMEVDKDISTVEGILVDLKGKRVSRNEPVLVVGGGVMADVGGFACALYHRNTPYVMLCTSIVSGIDAGPSPRTCCDGLGYKNVFGAYHPPILTLTDRQFFNTLETGWIRHGIAEIIKMAVTKDSSLFECLEEAGNELVETKFGTENCEAGSDIDMLSEQIIAKAMDGYVRSEYGNLWETHQCRPHAYGHTWSPGFELQAGLLHGHAVAIGMGYGAYLSFLEGWISEKDFHRILKVISAVGLSLRHDILQNTDSLWSSQVKMTEKRGGNLCAPLPRGGIGKCGYLNELTRERLESTLIEYQKLCEQYERQGHGIEPHCRDVGLEDPSTVKQHADHAVPKGGKKVEEDETPTASTEVSNSAIENYNDWIANGQEQRLQNGTTAADRAARAIGEKVVVSSTAPDFDHSSLFFEGAEEYAGQMTTEASRDYVRIADATNSSGLFAPCMVGQIEGQFLKMIAQLKGARRVLDIGTFTGYSALSFADGMPADSLVVTIEADKKTAAVARDCFAKSENGDRIELVEGDALAIVKEMVTKGEKFDIVFLDADKVNYKHYYEAGLCLLSEGGVIMADNALCSLVYGKDDIVRHALHEFNVHVQADKRVEQVMLTVREGILLVQKV